MYEGQLHVTCTGISWNSLKEKYEINHNVTDIKVIPTQVGKS